MNMNMRMKMLQQGLRKPYWKLFEMGAIPDGIAGSEDTDFEEYLIGTGEAGATGRAQFLQEARLDPPDFLRVIDCELSVGEEAVVIIDCPKDVRRDVQATSAGSASCSAMSTTTEIGGYTAISHTYGQDVYDAFNCGCAADCRAHVARADPTSPCKHDNPEKQQKVIGDVLGMCRLLVDAGVRYAWHDGVCIAQYDDKEVKHFIEHIAWIYANADDTVIFLHYIGRPMAPIAPPSYEDGPISRWQTRVWTFQEAALSKHRRYCVRMGNVESLKHSPNFKHKLASWYQPDGPNFTVILDEPEFIKMFPVMFDYKSMVFNAEDFDALDFECYLQWHDCVLTWLNLVRSLRFSFPTIAHALDSCSSRESKHEGDRINSILGLARVKGFSAHKEENVEWSTMQFFMRMGQAGLAIALFTPNKVDLINDRPHTWYPTLCSPLQFTPSHFRPSGPNFHTDHLEFEVRSDGSLEVRGPLACVSLHVTPFYDEKELDDEEDFIILESIMTTCQSQASIMTNCQSLSAFVDFTKFYSMGICNVLLAEDNLRSNGLLGTALPAVKQTLLPRLFEHFPEQGEIEESHYKLAFSEVFGPEFNSGPFNLIFPAELLESGSTVDDVEDVHIENESYLWKPTIRSFAAVMVRGEVQSAVAVEKVGCFIGSPMLLQVLQESHDYLTS